MMGIVTYLVCSIFRPCRYSLFLQDKTDTSCLAKRPCTPPEACNLWSWFALSQMVIRWGVQCWKLVVLYTD